MSAAATGVPDSGTLSLDRARLAAANINPYTGLATDYLNHFNEAIMLLEMLPCAPECAEDFLAWRPLTYQQHFEASNFKDRELAIAAYEFADPASRRELDDIVMSLNAILVATREAVQLGLSQQAIDKLSAQTVGWLKPMVARAGAVINGNSAFVDQADAPQDAIDALFAN